MFTKLVKTLLIVCGESSPDLYCSALVSFRMVWGFE